MAAETSIPPIDPGPIIAAMDQAEEASFIVNEHASVDQGKEGCYTAVSQTGSKVFQA